jgi:parallel beta-helix repeat protein
LENKCNNTQLVNNIANSNTGYHGILLDQSCSCTIENNTANSNTYYGSYLYRSSNNNLINNTVSNNNRGIVLSYSSDDNTITGNTANSNDNRGIYLNSSSNNQIYNNYFDNNNNAYDNGNNTWNTTKTAGTNIIGGSYLGGNYWGDYTGVDNNEDGLGDTLLPYNCSGSIQNDGDFLPLIESSGEIYVPDDYPTIQSAVENASNGDTIIVRDGTYNENVNVNKRLVIRSENGAASTTIHASDPDDHVIEVQRDYVDINGFTVEGYTEYGKAGICLNSVDHCNISDNNAQGDYYGPYGIYLSHSDYNTLTNNTAHSNYDHGIYLLYSSNNNLTNNHATSSSYSSGIKLAHSSSNSLTNNYANSNNRGSGIFLQSSSNYNTFTNNHANSNEYGISFDGSSSDSNHNTFTGNTMNSNGMGVYSWSSDYNNFTNNTISSNSDEGMWFTGSSYNTIENNTITDNVGVGLVIASISNTVRYNTVASNKDGIHLWDARDNNVSCNWVHNNNEKGFHLTSGSTGNIIGNNNIMSNGASANDSWHYNFYNDQENAVTAASNYWGTDNETLIAESIYDWNEDSSKGNVTFQPISEGPAPCAPIPELATVVLFSVGLLVLAGYMRITKKKE